MMRKLLPPVTAGLVLATSSGLVAADVPTEVNALSPIGVVDNRNFDTSASLGAAWTRVPIQWKFFESQDGTFEFSAAQEQWLTQLEALNMHMSPVVVMGLGWFNHQPGDPWQPDDDPNTEIPDFPSRSPNDMEATYDAAHAYSESYYDYIFTFVDTYGDRIDRITIENEVNTAASLNPEFWDSPIEDYIKILVTARKATMDADPTVKVYESGMGSGSWGVAVAEGRWQGGTGPWSFTRVRDFLREYYVRDVYARPQIVSIRDIYSPTFGQNDLNALLAHSAVVANNDVVRHVLENLWSDDLNMMLVDGLNIKFTGDYWQMTDLIEWIDETIAAAVPPFARGNLPLPKVNNEASNWCLDINDFNTGTGICTLDGSEGPQLAKELLQKIAEGLENGVEQTLWFPFTNDLTVQAPTPRLGLYDYDGNETDAAVTFKLLARLLGGERDYKRLDLPAGGNVRQYVFEERVTMREDIHVLWWDDGGHGAGSASVDIPVIAGTMDAWRFTQAGDSTALDTGTGTVSVTVTEEPIIVYFDDNLVPVWPVEPVQGPRPVRVTLAPPTPSPSFGHVRIAFGVPEARPVSLAIFDVSGRLVANLLDEVVAPGTYRVTWDGRSMSGTVTAEGVYVVRLDSGADRLVEKVVRLR